MGATARQERRADVPLSLRNPRTDRRGTGVGVVAGGWEEREVVEPLAWTLRGRRPRDFAACGSENERLERGAQVCRCEWRGPRPTAARGVRERHCRSVAWDAAGGRAGALHDNSDREEARRVVLEQELWISRARWEAEMVCSGDRRAVTTKGDKSA